ncbi:MAG: hypothetical protein RIR53_1842 [Bacteroidota bacterium]|jgi:predicted amidohydrolase YtcJ
MFAEIHVERGRIRAVLPCLTGTIIRTETDTFSYPGCHVYPGLVDNHAHIVLLGEQLTFTSLATVNGASELLSAIAASDPVDGWLRATGWNEECWTDRRIPTRDELDRITGGTPLFATRIDTHAALVNTAALHAVGLDPAGMPEVLIDDDLDPFWSALPAPSADTLRQMIERAALECVRHGITEVHDMHVHLSWLDVYRTLAESGRLPIRVQAFVGGQSRQWLQEGQLPAGGELLRVCGVKLFADGALGSRGAFLSSPYEDEPTTSGRELLTAAEMRELVTEIVHAGWPCVAIHAIGDEAVHNVIDVYEQVRGLTEADDVILRLEHAQIVRDEDVARMAASRIMACVQPTHCISDAPMAERRLGAERIAWSYRWRSLLEAGVHIGAGSDFPIESPDPIAGMAAFVNRIPRDGDVAWRDSEMLTRAEALEAFTLAAHVTSGMDYRRGTIAVGCDADLTILDSDLLNAPEMLTDSRHVVATFVAGTRRYER